MIYIKHFYNSISLYNTFDKKSFNLWFFGCSNISSGVPSSIILPQAFKNILPALANEFIVLLKETSVAGYVALQDLTKGGDIIRSRTYSAFMPLITVAVIYLVMVMFFTYLVGRLERRLRNDER